MTPRKKKKYLTDERIDKEIRKLGVVFCPSCKSEKVFSGMSVNREIDTDMFRLEVSYSCKEVKCDRNFQINLIVMDIEKGDTYQS